MAQPRRATRRPESRKAGTRAPIKPRNRQFTLADEHVGSWHSDNPYISHFFNGLSLTFPYGEPFFINAIRRYRDWITDPELRAQVAAFIGQESIHAREHRRYNDMLRRRGYPADLLELITNFSLWMTALTPGLWQLGITCAFEHFTAIMAEAALGDGDILDGAVTEYAEMWRWHCAEEIEHKGVAFDVLHAVAPGWLAYLVRTAAMTGVTANFLTYSMFQQVSLAAFDHLLLDPKAAAAALWYFWINPGLMPRGFRRFASYYKPSFHPWELDDSDLLERWQQADTTQP